MKGKAAMRQIFVDLPVKDLTARDGHVWELLHMREQPK